MDCQFAQNNIQKGSVTNIATPSMATLFMTCSTDKNISQKFLFEQRQEKTQ